MSATLSSTLHPNFPAEKAIDGDSSTLFATQSAQTTNQWVSVQVPAGSPVTSVAVYNRADGEPYESWLSPYEVWLGATAGALTHSCGGGPITLGSSPGLGPFSTSCGGRSDLPYVTILMRSGTFRYLAIGEVKVYR